MTRASVWAWGLVVAFLAVIWGLNACSPFSSDDFLYGIAPQAVDGVRPRLGSLAMVWQATLADGYRPVVHVVERIFTGVVEKSVFNVANTVVMGLFLLLVHRLAMGAWQMTWRKVVLVIGLVFLILCKGESYLWGAGSCNYLWAGVATLAFCLMREKVEAGKVGWWLVPMCAGALLCGWAQEGFALPICFGLGLYTLTHWRELNGRKVTLYGFYGVGALLLCWAAAWRVQTVASPSVMGVVLNQMKIWVAAKGVWCLVVLFLFIKEKRAFLKRNAFELWVCLGSLLMISAVGFNGERSLWCANLMAIVIVVREVTLPKWCAGIAVGAGAVLCAVLLMLGLRVRESAETCARLFLASADGVTCHERVQCGVLARFFHQSIFTWQRASSSNLAYGDWYGRGVSPCALSREMYETLYVADSFCVPKNRLPIAGEFYTTPTANAIVMPLKGEEASRDWENTRVEVEYAFPEGLVARVKLELAMRRDPPVPGQDQPQVLVTAHGSYLLIGKLPESDGAIRGVRFAEKRRGR